MEPFAALLNNATRDRALPARGFTIIEMLVALGIVAVIMTVVLLGQTNFNRSLILTDSAYTVAFSIRQAQSLGLSSRKVGTIQNAGYGVHFVSGATKTYTLFADTNPVAPGSTQSGACPGHTVTTGLDTKPGNCIFDTTPADATVSSYTIRQGFTISNFCGVDTTGSTRCSGSYLDSLSITFLRPSTQATIIGVRGGAIVPLTQATIYLSSPDGSQQRCVKVSTVGQIAVGACS